MQGETTVTCRFCGYHTTPKTLRRHWRSICDKLPPLTGTERLCSRCQQIKSTETDFSIKAGSLDGLNNDCKQCSIDRFHQWRKDNPNVDRRDFSRIKPRPGRWKLKPCRYCARHYTHEGMFIHLRECEKHPRTHPRAGKLQPADPFLPNMEEMLNNHAVTPPDDKQRHRNLLAKYGMTLDDYNRMLAAQNGVCAICHLPPSGNRNSRTIHLAVDHCHTSGKIRKLLCSHCNAGVGGFKDDPTLLRAAIAYLESFTATEAESHPESPVS